jgi:hypothetical protein
MAKAKRNWKHIHKIRVHHNRWLWWTVALSILMAVALVGYIKVSNIYFDTQFGHQQEVMKNWNTFTNKSYGYIVKYPKNWAIEAESQTSLNFVNPADAGEYFSVTVYPITEEKVVREELSNRDDDEEEVTLVKEDGTLYVLRGKSDLFDRIVESFRFQQKLERV